MGSDPEQRMKTTGVAFIEPSRISFKFIPDDVKKKEPNT
jgi:hypothetical protein